LRRQCSSVDPELNTFTQYYGSTGLDASLLFVPLSGFLPTTDARVAGTVEALERELLPDGLLLRFKPETEVDGLVGEEGVFLACSFWLATVYQMMGRHDDARRLFERAASTRNDLGLLALVIEIVGCRQGLIVALLAQLSGRGSYLNHNVMRAFARLKDEGRKGLVVVVYFAIGFLIIQFHNRLLVEGSDIKTASYVRGLVGGLIAAKVLLSVDMLPFFDAFPRKPMIFNIGWKTALYTAGVLGFLYAEPFLEHFIGGAGLYASHFQAWQELTLPRTWAKVIWVVVLLLGFVIMQELSREIGKDSLKKMFFGPRDKLPTDRRRRFGDAA
jgi:hypothetical protein